jgi:hypothetical protein
MHGRTNRAQRRHTGNPRIKSPVCKETAKAGHPTPRPFAYSPRHAALIRARRPAPGGGFGLSVVSAACSTSSACRPAALSNVVNSAIATSDRREADDRQTPLLGHAKPMAHLGSRDCGRVPTQALACPRGSPEPDAVVRRFAVSVRGISNSHALVSSMSAERLTTVPSQEVKARKPVHRNDCARRREQAGRTSNRSHCGRS